MRDSVRFVELSCLPAGGDKNAGRKLAHLARKLSSLLCRRGKAMSAAIQSETETEQGGFIEGAQRLLVV